MCKVENDWKGAQNERIEQCDLGLLAKGFAQANQREQRNERTDKNIDWVQWFLAKIFGLETPEPRPHENDSADAAQNVSSRMSLNEAECLSTLLLHVSKLSDSLEFRPFRSTSYRKDGPVPPVQGVADVSYTGLHPEIVFQEDRFVERPIVSNEPGRDGGEQGEDGDHQRSGPISCALLQAVANPPEHKWQDAQGHRRGECSQTCEDTEHRPCSDARPAFHLQR